MNLMDWLRVYHAAHRPGWQALELAGRLRDQTSHALKDASRQRSVIVRAVAAARRTAIAFPESTDPTVSIVIPVFNNWQLTERCLASLCASAPLGTLEVIVVDDASSDGTAAGLQAVPGLRVLSNETNLGFTRSVNRGARAARGRFLFFLNNDTVVLPGCVEGLLRAMEEPAIGAVGAKLVYASGHLQEAGGIVWRDGTGWNIGRGRSSSASQYNFRRDVDYCSAAALLVRAATLRTAGYVDERYSPAYYEDTDLCFAVRSLGHRVVCEPSAVVMHEEGRTHGTEKRQGLPAAHSKANQEVNRATFVAKWATQLQEHAAPPSGYSLRAELLGSQADARPRVLICDWTVPTPDRDSGGHRMDWIVRLLSPLCSLITFVPVSPYAYPAYASLLRQRGVEVLSETNVRFRNFMRSRQGLYDVVILSRTQVAHNRLRWVRRFQPRASVIFDTVDLKSVRLEREKLAVGRSFDGSPARHRKLEDRLIRDSDMTATVSEQEATAVRSRAPAARTIVLPNVHEVPDRRVPDFVSRRGLLFIGSFMHPPNADAVRWFALEVLPVIRSQIDVDLVVIGPGATPAAVASWGAHTRYLGWVPDVLPAFDSARLGVVPLRYGAGMKGKVGQAMSLGLPVVTTSIGAEGMDLVDGRDVLIEDDAGAFAGAVVRLHEDAELWSSLSRAGQSLVAERWAPDAMRIRLLEVLRATRR
jgi:GT2 family glycosyltransferase